MRTAIKLERKELPYIEDVAKIFLALTQFYASDNIRISSAGALPSLIKCFKEANPG